MTLAQFLALEMGLIITSYNSIQLQFTNDILNKSRCTEKFTIFCIAEKQNIKT